MNKHLVGGVGCRCSVRRRCPRLRRWKTGLDGGGASPAVGEVFFGGWGSGKGGRKRRIIGGDGGGGGTRGKVRLWRSLGLPGGAGSAFSYVASAASAPDRILPDRGRREGAGYFLGLRLAPARFWGRRWYTNLTPKPKKLSGGVLTYHARRLLADWFGMAVDVCSREYLSQAYN
jgi:hypothetical protein